MEFFNILVGIDFDVSNVQLIKFSFELAKSQNAKITFVHCYHPNPKDIELGKTDPEKAHLGKLVNLIDPIGNLYVDVEYISVVIPQFTVDGLVSYQIENEHDLIIVGKSKNNSWIPTKSKSVIISEKCNIPTIIIPEDFRMINLNNVVFNLDFEFREIEKIYDLLILCDRLGAILTCVHVTDRKSKEQAIQNMNVYKKLFEGQLIQDNINFELLDQSNNRELEFFAKDIEADIIVLSKTRKTWINHYIQLKEEKLSKQIGVPILLFNF